MIDAASRLAYFDRATFFAFQDTTAGLRSPRTSFPGVDDLDVTGFYSRCAADACSVEKLTTRGRPVECTVSGARASADFIDMPAVGLAEPRRLAVLVELSSSYVWTYSMQGGELADFADIIK